MCSYHPYLAVGRLPQRAKYMPLLIVDNDKQREYFKIVFRVGF